MRLIFDKLLKFWPVVFLIIVECILLAANYTHGSWLMGWDNVMPELNFHENFLRSIFGVWQEHRGLGLYDGMSHIANLTHTLFLWLLSFVLPVNLLRYTFTFLMHILGGIGMYFLISHIFQNRRKGIPFTGALFYLFNPATIQMFYTPLEAFSVHFTSLPWLALVTLRYLQTGTRKNFLRLLFVFVLITPQFFIPTLLIPTAILLTAITGVMIIGNISSFKTMVTRGIAAFGAFCCINAFWLLPYLYGLPANGPVIADAKINQMSSNEDYLRNQVFGNLANVLLFRGFSLNFEDTKPDQSTGYLMETWRNHLYSPAVMVIGMIIGSVILIGILFGTVSNTGAGLSFFLMYGISIVFLANNTPFVKTISEGIRGALPLLDEALRFPFTKFSLLFAFSSTIFLAFGLQQILQVFQRVAKRSLWILLPVSIAGIIYLSLPAFWGNFIYTNLRVTLPTEYSNIFGYLNAIPHNERVAILPQQQYWSWKLYGWGYRGSGFLWYGMSQPLLDRAVDPWSTYSENFYWELSRALYAKNINDVLAVLNKYDVHYILLDENIISASTNRALFIDETKEILNSTIHIKQLQQYGKLTLYERTDRTSQSYIRLTEQLPVVSPPYRWTDNDVAYREVGDYINTSDKQQVISDKTILYPFRSLFTKRSVNEREFSVKEDVHSILLSSTDASDSASIDKRDALVFEATPSDDLSAAAVIPCSLLANGTASASDESEGFLRFQSKNQRNCLSFGAPDLTHANAYLVTVESRHVTGRPLLFSLINETAKHVELETYLSSMSLRAKAKQSQEIATPRQQAGSRDDNAKWQTDYFILPPLAPDGLGYSMYISNDAIGSDETINDIKSVRFYKLPYNDMVHFRTVQSTSNFDNAAIQQLNNTINVSHPNPAYYRISLQSQISNPESRTLILNQAFDEGWKAYAINTNNPIIQLSNDPIKRKLFESFPFLFGTEINPPAGGHVMVNNWANAWLVESKSANKAQQEPSTNSSEKANAKPGRGWIIGSEVGDSRLEIGDNTSSTRSPNLESRTSTIVIFFTPQLLEWMGFLLLPVPFLILLKKK